MLLAVDTSTRRTGIALYDGTQVLSETAWISNFHHTVELAPAVANALRRVGGTMNDLEVLSVAIGPGSFTSLRTGLAYAKGFALARHIPLIGIPSLDILATAQPATDLPMAVVLEIGRRRLAVGWYEAQKDTWMRLDDYRLMTVDALADSIRRPTVICGELNQKAQATLKRKWKNVHLASPAWSQRRPGFLAELGWIRWLAGDVDDPIQLAPIYLSNADEE